VPALLRCPRFLLDLPFVLETGKLGNFVESLNRPELEGVKICVSPLIAESFEGFTEWDRQIPRIPVGLEGLAGINRTIPEINSISEVGNFA
jgi:hypothetical protein